MTQMEKPGVQTAVLYSAKRPNPDQWNRFSAFLQERYGKEWTLRWQEEHSPAGGFRLEAGADLYDWSTKSRLEQLQNEWKTAAEHREGNVIPLLKETLKQWTPKVLAEEIGTVRTVGDGIATVEGLPGAFYGEVLLFPGGLRGMVQELRRDTLSCILFGEEEEIEEGSPVRRTGKVAGIPAGEAYLGRIVDALGNPIDGKGEIPAEEYYPLERPAPGIIDRQPVSQPLETGLLAIDSMFPIGRGQRELIIGDRQTGKTSLALDTILNQKGKGVICIYTAIGQKASSVAALAETLKQHGAMEYSIVLAATAGDSDALQYIAPYAGCALGEYFMHQGKDVLIVYDDLSKHAIAYRSISLLLERSPGREAYPGDVFYLHSRLLERAAHLSESLGGGSMSALPIVETQAGDVSAYIPTNIISITDGQIFLESNLFFAGQRPAVNVGLSVSRVGGDAQTKAMRQAAGSIRLELAQYREIEVFTQFASDLDDATRRQLRYGQGLMKLLCQPRAHPMSQHQQVITLVTALNHVLLEIPPEKIKQFQQEFLEHMEKNEPELCREIDQSGFLREEVRTDILKRARNFERSWRVKHPEEGR